jgi:hypothetical protein
MHPVLWRSIPMALEVTAASSVDRVGMLKGEAQKEEVCRRER